jgi:hypothetical protein
MGWFCDAFFVADVGCGRVDVAFAGNLARGLMPFVDDFFATTFAAGFFATAFAAGFFAIAFLATGFFFTTTGFFLTAFGAGFFAAGFFFATGFFTGLDFFAAVLDLAVTNFLTAFFVAIVHHPTLRLPN